MQKILPTNAVLIPASAKRVFNGDIFDVYQWPQKMFDGSTKTFEMLRRPDTVKILVVRDHQMLLVKEEQPGRTSRTHMPGGRTNADDPSWLAAAKRELREETGLTCENWRLITVGQPQDKIEYFIPLYLAWDIAEEQSQKLDPDGEKIELIWREFDEVRSAVISGRDSVMTYMTPLFTRIKTIEELQAMPAFVGIEANR